MTVYEKGAEVIRLYHTMLGAAGFRKGMDLYFKRHDGQAVTCDDFLSAMADANSFPLEDLAVWYSQAGTPVLSVSTSYCASDRTFSVKCAQKTSGRPVLIPIAVGLIGPDGKDIPLTLQGQGGTSLGTTTVLRLATEEETFVFTGVEAEPVASLLRNFSAPVKLEIEGRSTEQHLFLLAHDSDPYNRWEAGQRLMKSVMLELYDAVTNPNNGAKFEDRIQCAGAALETLNKAADAFRNVLEVDLARPLTTPSFTSPINPKP